MMQVPAWATRYPWLSVMGACVVLGAAIGWLANPPPRPPGSLDESNAWQLPEGKVVDRYNAAHFQALTQSNAWKAPPDVRVAGGRDGDGAQQPGGWMLVGIVTAEGPWALVTPQGGKTERLTIGNKLPDGATLTKIGDESIEFSSGGCVQRRSLFPTPGSSTTRAVACTPAAGAPAPGTTAGGHHE